MNQERPNPENNPLEQLLESHPNFLVERDQAGFFSIYKKLSDEETRRISVSVLHNIHISELPEVVVSGSTLRKNPEKDSEQGGVYTVNTTQSLTFVKVTRNAESTLEASVTYPASDRERIYFADLLDDAVIGLEIFDAFSNLDATEKSKYQDRIYDGMEELDLAEYWKLLRAMDESSGMNTEGFLRDIGADAGSIKGTPKIALLALRGAKNIPVSDVKFNK